jgi:alkylhydroperoxidase/carboxymuconolactone decarboxylase family protein YurZ
MEGCLNAGATIDEIKETLKIGVIGGGSFTYPNERFAMHALEEFTAGSALSQEEKLKE